MGKRRVSWRSYAATWMVSLSVSGCFWSGSRPEVVVAPGAEFPPVPEAVMLRGSSSASKETSLVMDWDKLVDDFVTELGMALDDYFKEVEQSFNAARLRGSSPGSAPAGRSK